MTERSICLIASASFLDDDSLFLIFIIVHASFKIGYFVTNIRSVTQIYNVSNISNQHSTSKTVENGKLQAVSK